MRQGRAGRQVQRFKLPLDAPHVLDASFLPGREVWCDRRWTESSAYGAQVPLMHVAPELVQSTHVAPVFPHAVSSVPGWQVPPPLNGSPEQQPPLHGVSFGWLHDVVQRAMPASRQARPAGQSPCEVHPQWYPDPVPLGTQTVPDWFAASQTSQSSPLPQALSTLPGWQVPSLQQPPWQMEWFASPHALSHWPVVVLQAMPIGQSPAPLHGHSPGVQHTPNFAVGAFAHRRLQQLWLVRQVPPSGLQLLASASRYPPRVSTTAAKRNAPRARCFIAHLPVRAQAMPASSPPPGRAAEWDNRTVAGAASSGSVGRDRHTRPLVTRLAAGVPHSPRRVATHADLPAHPVGRLAAGPGHSPYKPPS